jgi:hypothetical protein
MYSKLFLYLSEGLISESLPVKILKALLHSFFLATYVSSLKMSDLLINNINKDTLLFKSQNN